MPSPASVPRSQRQSWPVFQIPRSFARPTTSRPGSGVRCYEGHGSLRGRQMPPQHPVRSAGAAMSTTGSHLSRAAQRLPSRPPAPSPWGNTLHCASAGASKIAGRRAPHGGVRPLPDSGLQGEPEVLAPPAP